MSPLLIVAFSLLVLFATGQLLKPQTNTFHSNFTLSKDQIASLNLSSTAANNIEIATRFEQSNWATGSVFHDPFYINLPCNATSAPAGSLLKLETFTPTSNFTIAPTLALSRLVYQSKTLNGTLVPVSAYILWPYLPRGGGKTLPLVSFGHGTSGVYAECAPSHIRNLWYQFSGPYSLALSGYAVVATDYAGLGVANFPDGKNITHQYGASPAAGNDLLYAAQAAQAAFPDHLSKEFVVMGHSEGGGAAWGAAQQQVKAKVPGYIGSIAASPLTDVAELLTLKNSSLGNIQSAQGILYVFPNLSLSCILTDAGMRFMNLVSELSGCNSVFTTTLTSVAGEDLFHPSVTLTRDEFLNSSYMKMWTDISAAGGRDFEGPLLVLHGTADPLLPEQQVAKYVNKTCALFPGKELHYVKVNGISHVPVMYATQQIWLDWLDKQFNKTDSGKKRTKCSQQEVGSNAPRPLREYQAELNYFLEYSLDAYQVA